MVKVNDKVVLVNKMGMFDNLGDVYTVVYVNDDYVLCTIETSPHTIGVSHDKFYEYFTPYEEPIECGDYFIDEILNECDIVKATAFDKCMIVSCKLPSGQVIVEHYDCCCPKSYDEKVAYEICLNNIISKIYEFETYADARIDMMLDDENDDDCDESDDEESSNLNTIKYDDCNNYNDKFFKLDIPEHTTTIKCGVEPDVFNNLCKLFRLV